MYEVLPVEMSAMLEFGSKTYLLKMEQSPGECGNCGGAGHIYWWVREQGPSKSPFPVGTPSRFIDGAWYAGETMSSPCPVCMGDQLGEWIAASCGVEPRFLNVYLKDYQPMNGKTKAKEVAEALVRPDYPVGLFTFYGKYGRGKTFLLYAIANELREKRIRVRYMKLSAMLEEARDKFTEGGHIVSQAIRHFQRYPVLLLDEIDKVNLTGWALETTLAILDYRYANQGDMLTIMAMNSRPDQLPEELGWLGSRISEGIPILIDGEDVRPSIGLKKEQRLLSGVEIGV